MELIAVKYVGTKPYRDRTALRNHWQTGDVKRVPARDAKTLLRFAEFAQADPSEATDKAGDVETAVAAHLQLEQDQRNETEGILLLVQAMDKDALEAYAQKYEVQLDKRRSPAKLRDEVTSLIEQFGVR